MLQGVWQRLRRWAMLGSCAALCATSGVWADEPGSSDIKDLKAQLEAQQKQIQLLQKQLDGTSRPAATDLKGSEADGAGDDDKVKKAVEDYLKAADAKKKKAEEDKKFKEKCEGYEVGSDLSIKVNWNPGSGITFETPHKDFTLHVGGRFQEDFVFWNESTQLRPGAQMGVFEDGTFFRRVRLNLDGTAWEVLEWNMEYAFENYGNNTGIGELDEFWVGIKDMPIIGTIRIGHLKVPQGLEGDMVSSSKDMTFMERASYTDAFYENFAPGIWFGNHILCDRATWSAMLYKQEMGTISGQGAPANFPGGGAPNGAAIVNNDWGVSGRLTALPIYEHEGRCLVHLGASETYRSALFPQPVGAPNNGGNTIVDFAARPEMRDTIGNYNNVGPGNSKRAVDTGALSCNDTSVTGFEALAIWGPLTVQAEWAIAIATSVTAVTNAAGTTAIPSQNIAFNGGYAQVAYLLTGESRGYDRRLGRLQSNGVRPHTPFWFVRDRDGRFCTGLGAWEVAARYSYLDLNSGPVRGGELGSTTFGINWYLNNNFKIQFEYLNTMRWNMGDPNTGAVGNNPGTLDSFGIRTQILF
jgi:phosphate-selective porin OprO/OprP